MARLRLLTGGIKNEELAGNETLIRVTEPELIAYCANDEMKVTTAIEVPAALVRASRPDDVEMTLPAAGVADRVSDAEVEVIDPKALEGAVVGGRYLLTGVLATTAGSVVYKAVHTTLGTPAAVKVLLGAAAQGDAGARFLQEARAAASLRDPAFVRVFDCGVTDEGQPYFAMELLAGETLEQRLRRSGRLTPAEVVAIGSSVARALATLHAGGWVHRDVKPSNIFILAEAENGNPVKLLDLGVVRRTQVTEAGELRVTRTGKRAVLTVAGLLMGTPRYMSPEQVLGEPLDGRSDLYSLGIVLYEALTGTPPFRAGRLLDVLAAQVQETPEALALRAPDAACPAALELVIRRALAKEARARHDSAHDMASALESSLAAGPAVLPRAPRRHGRNLVAALAALAVLVGASVCASQSRTAPVAVAGAVSPYEGLSPLVASVSPIESPADVNREAAELPPVRTASVVEAKAEPKAARSPAQLAPKASGAAGKPQARSARLQDLKNPFH